MEKDYDGWILKDKNGDWWYGTFCEEKKGTESHQRDLKKTGGHFNFKLVKVKLTEVE